MKTLLEILSLRRPHRGVNESRVALKILTRLPYQLEVFNNHEDEPMAFVMCTDPKSRTLFTAHLDTVHRDEETPNPVIYDADMNWMSKDDGTALGADDGAGVWLLYKMIEAGVSGTYLFPLGEECGGIGAKWMAEFASEFLSGFDRAIAFDRAGTTDVITHQGWHGRCCSDEFATCLAAQLNTVVDYAQGFCPDETGVYTDTAEFVELIPECTNVSVGYYAQHGGKETLDVEFLQTLLRGCLKIQWEDLPTVRDNTEPQAAKARAYGSSEYDFDWDWYKSSGGASGSGGTELTPEDLRFMSDEDLYTLAYESPEQVAELLIDMKYAMEVKLEKQGARE